MLSFGLIFKDCCMSILSVLTYILRVTEREIMLSEMYQVGYHMLLLVPQNINLPRRQSNLVSNTNVDGNVTVLVPLHWF